MTDQIFKYDDTTFLFVRDALMIAQPPTFGGIGVSLVKLPASMDKFTALGLWCLGCAQKIAEEAEKSDEEK